MTAAAGASDSSGYLNGARLLAAGKLQTQLRLPPELWPPSAADQRVFTPLGFVTSPQPTHMIPAYATGLPLHFAAAAKILGWSIGPRVIELFAAAAAVWLCYLVGREPGLPASLAGAGATVLAVCPIFLFTSIQALSDTLATTWCLAAFYCALRARQSTGWAAACGAALSIAVLVRLTNLFLVPALLVLLGLDWRRLIRFALAGVPAAAWLAFYNRHQFGGVLATGYGSVAGDFTPGNGVPTLIHFAKWLALLLPAILLILPVAALAGRSTRTRELLALAIAFCAIAGFYLFYDISQQVWWCLRYILPVVPFLIVAGLLGVEALARGPAARGRRGFRPLAAIVIAGWAVCGSLCWTNQLHVLLVQRYEQTYADASLVARERLPTGSLVAANNFSGSIYFYTEFPVLRADIVVAEEFVRYAAIARQAGRPICAVLFDFEEEEAFARCPGQWKRLSTHANVGYWRLE
ncbi:MAG: ArnT family glycosyltransferase [Opitutaceae bacterium]